MMLVCVSNAELFLMMQVCFKDLAHSNALFAFLSTQNFWVGSGLGKVLQPNLQNAQSSGEIKFSPPAHACTEKVWVGEECNLGCDCPDTN